MIPSCCCQAVDSRGHPDLEDFSSPLCQTASDCATCTAQSFKSRFPTCPHLPLQLLVLAIHFAQLLALVCLNAMQRRAARDIHPRFHVQMFRRYSVSCMCFQNKLSSSEKEHSESRGLAYEQSSQAPKTIGNLVDSKKKKRRS